MGSISKTYRTGRRTYTWKQCSERGKQLINIIVHYPETPEKQAQFDLRVAKFHADYVAQYTDKLDCPTEQKLRLIDAIAESILRDSAENKEK